MRLLSQRPTNAAQVLFACACLEAEQLSFGVGVEHLVLACAIHGALDVEPDEIRERIVADERAALASLGISLDAIRDELAEQLGDGGGGCGLPVSPEAKRMLELATRRRRHVDAQQLLVTLRQNSGTARRLLLELGVD
ncbi:MAG TPA: hypothetical protein VNH40_03775 [Gaiellaceae bacterium]|nr:hypothetical protein [Gaiellaceae bacterium]